MPYVAAAVLVQNVVLNLVLIPRASFDAAAAATSISELTLAVTFTVLALRRTGRVRGLRVVAGPVAGGAAMAVVALLAPESLPVLAGALLAYGAVLVAVERLLFPADLALLLGVVTRRAGVASPSPPAGGGASGPG
jgi:O-antigen/teichoic acid export membrane protein